MNVSSEGIAYLAGYDDAKTLHSYTSKAELIDAIYILFSEWKMYTDVATRTVFDEMAWIAGAYDAVGFSLIRLKPVLAIPAGFGARRSAQVGRGVYRQSWAIRVWYIDRFFS